MKAKVEAISGADVVEKRSNLVTLMRALFDAVLAWGEKLVFTGAKDDSLPPDVLTALDQYLAESNAKLLVVLPLKDDRETEGKRKSRSALLMEHFETNTTPEQALARLEVVGRHSASALYNAVEYKRIPMRFLWLPLAKVQEGLGGKTQAIIYAVSAGLVALIFAMIFVPYPLKMEANGRLLPTDRQWLFSTFDAQVKDIPAHLETSGLKVTKDEELIKMQSLSLRERLTGLYTDIRAAEAKISASGSAREGDANDQAGGSIVTARIERDAKLKELDQLIKTVHANSDPNNYGEFWIRSPMTGIILSSAFRENLINKSVKPSEPLIRVGRTDPVHPKLSDWEIELKIPQKHIGQILEAFNRMPAGRELDVDFVVKSKSVATFRGKLSRDKVALDAKVDRTENNEPEPVVLAKVRLTGSGIAKEEEIPPSLLLSDIEVHTRVRCGDRAMGYSLLYGVWEFFYEKVIFFF